MTQSAGESSVQSPKNVQLSKYIKPQRSKFYLIKRLLWSSVQLPFWPKMPRGFSGLRIRLLRLFGARIGRNCLICGGVRVWEPWNLVMGDSSVIGDSTEIYNLAPITIGTNSVISQRAYLCTGTHDYRDASFPLISREIVVGDSVWIAAGVFIAPGITIEDGAVVGAYSVVTKSVPAWTVAAGNPCRPIKPREINL